MKKSISNAKHYTWGAACDGWHLLQTDSLSVIQERMPPGTTEQLHFHQKARQLFYVLSGEAMFDVEDDQLIIKAGESLHIPPMTKHRISNSGIEDINFIVISEPKAHGDRLNI
jgi:mannose-6-phosphate isomerase-like protein (cupin superfamily)